MTGRTLLTITAGGVILLGVTATYVVGIILALDQDISNRDWIALATLAYATFTLLTVLVLAIAAVFAVLQLKEYAMARHLQAINEIYRDIHSLESKAAREYVYTNAPEALADPSADRVKVQKVADSFEHVGLLAQHSLVAKDMILDYFWEAILEMWHRLGPYICIERGKRGRQYADHFEWLAGEAKEYQQRKYPDYKVGTRPAAPAPQSGP